MAEVQIGHLRDAEPGEDRRGVDVDALRHLGVGRADDLSPEKPPRASIAGQALIEAAGA